MRDVGHRRRPVVPSLNFVRFTIRKISGILCVTITPSVTLTFDLLTLKLVHYIALVVGEPSNQFWCFYGFPFSSYGPTRVRLVT